MALKPYTTQLKNGASWSVAIHEHHAAGPDSGYATRQAAAYEASQHKVGDTAKRALEAYTTVGGSRPDETPQMMSVSRSSTPSTVVSHRRTGTPGDEFPHASVRIFTPEGHVLSQEHVEGLMAGTHDAQELREHYQDQHAARQQIEYEEPIQRHLYRNNNTLPHSGVDALMLGVPTADSPEGAHILGQIRQGRTPGNLDYPHHLEGAGSENPKVGYNKKDIAIYEAKIAAGVTRDRANDRGRKVDHR
jgi:hypothetical protein